MTFSERIKDLRREKKFTQSDLSLRLNLPRTTVANWEQDRCEPNMNDLLNLSLVFGVSVGYLIGAEDEDGRPVPQDLPENDLQLLKAFHKLSVFEQETVLTQINALAEKVKG